MRRLILMRHAKSSWADAGQADHDRPLNGRGRRAAGLIGTWLRKNGRVPDAALVSTALRARETWAGVTRTLETEPPAVLRPDLYHADPQIMLSALHAAPDVACILMLGHQPGIGAFAERLLAAPPGTESFEKFPTGATAVIAFDAELWTDVDWGGGRLEDFVMPGALED